jgi:hypothetical protein
VVPAAPAVGGHAIPAPAGGGCGAGGCGGDCGGDCGCASDCCAPKCHHFHFSFHHKKCCCPEPCDCGCAAPAPACDCGCTCDCCAPKHCHHFHFSFHHKKCCDTSDCGCGCDGYGGGFDGGCCGGGAAIGGHGAPVMGAPGTPIPSMAPAGEPIKAPKDAEPVRKLPAGTTQSPPAVPEVTPTGINTEAKNPFELDRRYETRVDRAADYSWLTGQLHFVHADGGLWVLRYAPLEKEDPNGGSVVLARDRQMDSYREGDLVTVHGEIINPRGSIFLGGPLYRMQSIQLIDRADR